MEEQNGKSNPSAKQHMEHFSKGRNSFFPQSCPTHCKVWLNMYSVSPAPLSASSKAQTHEEGTGTVTMENSTWVPAWLLSQVCSWALPWWPDKQVGDYLQILYLTKQRASERSLKWRQPERSLEPCPCSCPTCCHCICPDLQHWAVAPRPSLAVPATGSQTSPATIWLLGEGQHKTAISSSFFLSLHQLHGLRTTLSTFVCFALFWHQLMPSTLVCNLVSGICCHEGHLFYKKSKDFNKSFYFKTGLKIWFLAVESTLEKNLQVCSSSLSITNISLLKSGFFLILNYISQGGVQPSLTFHSADCIST